MLHVTHCRMCLILVFVFATSVGCSERPLLRMPIHGTVTLDGKPLAAGDIVFEPKSGSPTRSGGLIQAGKFDVPVGDGPAPGIYAVAIFGGPVDPEAAAKFTGDAVRVTDPIYQKIREVVPNKYNIQTTLEVEVLAQGDNEFHFDLMSDKSKS